MYKVAPRALERPGAVAITTTPFRGEQQWQ